MPLLVVLPVAAVVAPVVVVVDGRLAKYTGTPANTPKCLLKSQPRLESILKILLSELPVPWKDSKPVMPLSASTLTWGWLGICAWPCAITDAPAASSANAKNFDKYFNGPSNK